LGRSQIQPLVVRASRSPTVSPPACEIRSMPTDSLTTGRQW
jgi:hypothetical protein